MTVKVFRSTDYGAPTNTNAAGALIAILDACLVNGYGEQNVVSITLVDNIATVTVVAAHGLSSGAFVKILGAEQPAYNGDFPITVTGANTFTYQVTGTPATPATGTIIKIVAPAGWTKPFSATNKAGYKQGAGSNGFYLRVEDTTTSAARVKGCENMTGIDVTVSDFPTNTQVSGGCYIQKNNSTTARPWDLIASEKFFVLITTTDQPSYKQLHIFGDIVSNKSGDAFGTVLIAPTNSFATGSETNNLQTSFLSSMQGHFIARAHTQIGSAVQCGKTAIGSQLTFGGTGGVAYPSPIDGALHLAPVFITEPNAGLRGKLPCVWQILHYAPFQQGDIITGTGEFAGKTFFASNTTFNVGAQALFEISDTW